MWVSCCMIVKPKNRKIFIGKAEIDEDIQENNTGKIVAIYLFGLIFTILQHVVQNIIKFMIQTKPKSP